MLRDALPFQPGQCNHDDVENGEGDEPARGLDDVAIDLVDAERGEHADRPRERPQLVFDQRIDQNRFDEAVRQQIDRREQLAPDGELFGRRAQVRGDEVVGVFAELVVRQTDDEVLNRAGREDQQQRAADQLEEAVEPLEDDADFERDVKLGACY